MAQIHTAQLRRMDALLKKPENRECFDCNSKQPRWASTNLGIFVCLRCAGVHRGIGVHITKVKSTNMDAWEDKMIDCVDRIGNSNGKLLYEARVPSGYKKLDQLCDNVTLERTIRQKYETRQFWAPNYDELYAQMMATPVTQAPSLIPISSQPSLTSLTTPATLPPSVSSFGGSSVPATTGGNGVVVLQGRVVSSSNNINANINNGATNTNISGNTNKKPATTSSAVDDLWGDFTSTPSPTPLTSQIVSPPSTAAATAVGAGTFQQQSRISYQNTNSITQTTCNTMAGNQKSGPSFMPEPSVIAANNFEEDFFGTGASRTTVTAGRGPAAPGVDFFSGGAGAFASPTGTFCSVATQRGSPVPSSSSRQNTGTLNDDFFSAGDWGNAAGSSPRSAVLSQSSSPAALTSNNNTNGANGTFGIPSNNTQNSKQQQQQQQRTPTTTNTNNNIITVEADDFFSGGFPTGGGVLPTSSSGMSSTNTLTRPMQQQKQQGSNGMIMMGIADDFFGGVKSPSSFAPPPPSRTVPPPLPPASSSPVPSIADERIALTLAALDRSRNVSAMGSRPQPPPPPPQHQQRAGGVGGGSTTGQLSSNGGPIAMARQW